MRFACFRGCREARRNRRIFAASHFAQASCTYFVQRSIKWCGRASRSFDGRKERCCDYRNARRCSWLLSGRTGICLILFLGGVWVSRRHGIFFVFGSECSLVRPPRYESRSERGQANEGRDTLSCGRRAGCCSLGDGGRCWHCWFGRR